MLNEISAYINQLQINAKVIAELDCLFSFSKIAQTNRYTKPNINNSTDLVIEKGRHPVIEQQLDDDEFYVPNDVILNKDSQQIMMITGPTCLEPSFVKANRFDCFDGSTDLCAC